MKRIRNPKDIIFSPAEIGTLGSQYIKRRKESMGDGVPLYFDEIDDDFIPLLDGEIMTILGRPGSGKSSFMMRWARARAHWLANNRSGDGVDDRVVVYATWEQHIEDLHAFHIASEKNISITQMSRGDLSDQEWHEVLISSTERINLPLWFIGHSIIRKERYGRIYIEDMIEGLHKIEDPEEYGYKIDVIFVDYLQRIPYQNESKVIGVSDNLDHLKDMALEIACPVVVGVQARREVDDRKKPIPTMRDAQWSSNVEQTSDKMFSLVRPRRYRKEGEDFGSITVHGHNQMLVSLLKQKLGIDNQTYWVEFDPRYNILDSANFHGKYLGEIV